MILVLTHCDSVTPCGVIELGLYCCLTTPSYHLNQCWLTISEVSWYSPEDNLTGNKQDKIRYILFNVAPYTWFGPLLFCCDLVQINVPKFFRVTSVALEKSSDFCSVNDTTLRNMVPNSVATAFISNWKRKIKLCAHQDCCTRSRYQGQGQLITFHGYYGMQLLVPAIDICFWHNTSLIYCGMYCMKYGGRTKLWCLPSSPPVKYFYWPVISPTSNIWSGPMPWNVHRVLFALCHGLELSEIEIKHGYLYKACIAEAIIFTAWTGYFAWRWG